MDPIQPLKMTKVTATALESIGYQDATRTLYIKFRDSSTLCFKDVPRFRLSGLMNAPRKDAYYQSFIKNQFLTSEVRWEST
jgi:hypothetical protein